MHSHLRGRHQSGPTLLEIRPRLRPSQYRDKVKSESPLREEMVAIRLTNALRLRKKRLRGGKGRWFIAFYRNASSGIRFTFIPDFNDCRRSPSSRCCAFEHIRRVLPFIQSRLSITGGRVFSDHPWRIGYCLQFQPTALRLFHYQNLGQDI